MLFIPGKPAQPTRESVSLTRNTRADTGHIHSSSVHAYKPLILEIIVTTPNLSVKCSSKYKMCKN